MAPNYPPDTSFLFKGNPGLPTGLRIDPFISKGTEVAFRLVLVNESNKTIKLGSTTSLGRISFVKNQTIKVASSSTTNATPQNFEECLKDIPEEYQEPLGAVLNNHHHSFAFQTSELGHTDLVKHVIDTQEQGPIR